MLAYFDGIRCLVPVRVERVEAAPFGNPKIHCTVTADRPGYRRGDTFETYSTRVFPRSFVRKPRGSIYPVLHPYNWTSRVGYVRGVRNGC